MKRILLAVPLFFILSSLAQNEGTSDDLSLVEYDQVGHALTQGDETKLPACRDRVCREDLRHLIKASALRIQWNLSDSLNEAYRCAALSQGHHDLTYYTCARLVSVDAESLFGFFGEWSTIGLLFDATKRVVATHMWGYTGSLSSTPAAKKASQLEGLMLVKEALTYNSFVTSIKLFGDGIVNRSYVFDEQRLSDIKLPLAYPSAHVKINGVDLIMGIDTGSQTTSLHASAVKKARLNVLSGVESSWADGAGVSRVGKMGIADSLEFANIKVKNKYIHIVDDVTPLPEDGIIGLDVLDKLHSFKFTKDAFLIEPPAPSNCNYDFTVSSDLYSTVNGIIVKGSTINDAPVIAVLDTGNAIDAVAATWKLVRRSNLTVSNRHLSYWGGAGGAPSAMNSGDINGTLSYLGKGYTGVIRIGVNYPLADIDLNIGMPFFYGSDLYINFDTKKMCLIRK
ncbi:MAG: retropepsin-like aspartic protease [Rhodanobacter sp.]